LCLFSIDYFSSQTGLERGGSEGSYHDASAIISSDAAASISAPQTDPEISEFLIENTLSAQPDALEPPVSQTGTESPDDASVGLISATREPISQTGLETDEKPVRSAAAPEKTAVSKTDPESSEGGHENAAHPGESALSQTGAGGASRPEENIAPRAKKRAAKSQSGETDQTQSQSGTISAPARRRRREAPVLAIDDRLSVETDADKLKNDLLDLIESQKGRKNLTGTIQGVERSAVSPNISFAVIYHGAFKVVIPAEETVLPPEDFRDRSPADVMHYLLTKRLGAEIDYIVKGVDVKSGVAAASRLEAMAQRRRAYYFGADRDGNNLIYEGLVAEARVVSVIRAGVFVEMFGLEVYIPLRELSFQRLTDATAHYQSGQRVLVKILTLDRSDRHHIRVTASVKQAGENPYEQALKKYTPGSRYVGTVSLVDTNGVFVSLDGGIDCLCSYPKRGRPPRGSRVTVRIIGVNHESNRIWGAITHMTTVR
jgi:predicted RNA-binding protein with RPS1 domain